MQQLRFRWLFLSQQGLRALSNPRIPFLRFFGDDFPVNTDSDFVDFLWVNSGYESFLIHASSLKGFSLTISQSALTLFSLTFSQSTGVMSASQSTHRLWKVFRWQFPSRHRLRFRWLFLSQHVLAAIPNPRVTFEKCFGDYLRVDSDVVFVDYFWVNRGWGRWRIHASPLEVFSLTFSESTGVASANESTRHLWKRFCWRFRSLQRLTFCLHLLNQKWLCALTNPGVNCRKCFVDDFKVNRGFDRFQIHASLLEAVSVTISSQYRICFCGLFLSQQGLKAIMNPRITFERCFGDYLWVDSDVVFVDFF